MTTTVANQNANFTASVLTFSRPQATATTTNREPAARQGKSFFAVLLKALSAFAI